MGRMIFNILETNIAVSFGIVFLCLFAGKLRRRYGAGWMKLAWILLAVRLLIPYNFSMPFSGIRLLNYAGFEQEREFTVEGARAEKEDRLTAAYSSEPENNLMTWEGADWENAAGIVSDESGSFSSSDHVGYPDNQVTGTAPTQDGNQVTYINDNQAAFSYTNLLIKIWTVGVVVSLLYFICSYLFFYGRCKKSLRPITDTRLIKEICVLQKKYIGQVKMMAYKSSAVSSPMITGLVRPKLILPADKVQWNDKELELIMEHELCHYRKKDLWLKMLMVAACCVNWFSPMVYVMKKQFAYDMEFACDASVLAGRDEAERKDYARVMLMFAGSKREIFAFSTGFGGNRKRMKTRLDYMLDAGAKKKGVLSIITAAMIIMVMGVVVSCGYKAEEGNGNLGKSDAENGSTVDGGLQGEDEQNAGYSGKNKSEGNVEVSGNFDYNHVYNSVIRYYLGDLYLAKEDGIYYLKGGQGEGELLYSNHYELRRGMEIDGKYLYFCGSAPEEKMEEKDDVATVYRMDLDTHSVVDALEAFDLEYPDSFCTDVSVYEGNLYVAVGAASERFGFALNENGVAVSQLDRQEQDYIYREYNEYKASELTRLNTEFDSEEYWELTEAQSQRYQAVIDVASCKKLLDGRQVVSKYKDESLRSIYLENEDGTYEHVCDASWVYPMLVTETGLYCPDFSGEIWYTDFETRQTVKFYEINVREWAELFLITYDADYVYLLQSRDIGNDMENNTMTESYLVRVPRAGGDAQKVYRFAERVRIYGSNGWYRRCGVYGGRMYFDNRESFSLEPEENNMQAVNNGEFCEDSVEITETVRAFADAYFKNDEETLRALLAEDFEETIEMYAYPEQAGQIREEYIGGSGMPNENVVVGFTGYVFYEFSGHAETDDALAYLSIQITKTEEGFRVKWYGIEM